LDCFLNTIVFLSYYRRSPIALHPGGHGEWLGFKHFVDPGSTHGVLMTRVKALCNEFFGPDIPHSDLYVPTSTPRPAVVSPPVVHRLDVSIAQKEELFMVPASTPIVHSLALKSFAKQINKAKKVRACRFH
jgi:hypothetical protein